MTALVLLLSLGLMSPGVAISHGTVTVRAQEDQTPPADDGTGGPPVESTATPSSSRRPAPRATEAATPQSEVATPAAPAGTPVAATPEIGTPEPPEVDTACSAVLGVGEAGDACVAVVHAAPYAGAVDLYYGEDDVPTVAALEFEGFADFTAVPSDDELLVELTPAGDFATISLAEEYDLEPDQAYVLVVENLFPDYSLSLALIPLDLSPLGSEQARVSLYHAVADAGPLAVLGLPAPLDDGIESNTSGATAEIPADRYEVTIVPAEAQETVLLQSELQVEAGLTYLVVLTGLTTDATLTFAFAAAPVAGE